MLPSRTEAEPLGSKDALLERLDAVLAERRSRPITLSASIVICTRLRPADLAACLAAIEAERVAGREIVVVDNGPDAETEAVVRAAEGVRYIVEPIRGLNNARNTGLRAATGDVVVYVDDDVRPEPGWVDALLRRFDRPEVGVVCGLVLPEALETEGQIGFQYDLGFGGMGTEPIAFTRSYFGAVVPEPAGLGHRRRREHGRTPRHGARDRRLRRARGRRRERRLRRRHRVLASRAF